MAEAGAEGGFGERPVAAQDLRTLAAVPKTGDADAHGRGPLHRIPARIVQSWRDRETAERADVQTRLARSLGSTTDPLRRALLTLHQPTFQGVGEGAVCRGCGNAEDPDAELPEWPCPTWEVIESALPN